MTTRFASAAELMSKVLGLPGYAFVQIVLDGLAKDNIRFTWPI